MGQSKLQADPLLAITVGADRNKNAAMTCPASHPDRSRVGARRARRIGIGRSKPTRGHSPESRRQTAPIARNPPRSRRLSARTSESSSVPLTSESSSVPLVRRDRRVRPGIVVGSSSVGSSSVPLDRRLSAPDAGRTDAGTLAGESTGSSSVRLGHSPRVLEPTPATIARGSKLKLRRLRGDRGPVLRDCAVDSSVGNLGPHPDLSQRPEVSRSARWNGSLRGRTSHPPGRRCRRAGST